MPNSNSAPWIQAGPVANSSPVPAQSANMDDLVVEFRKKLDQLAYDKFGVMSKHRTYVKPNPNILICNPTHLAIESSSFLNLMGWITSPHGNILANIWLN